MNIVMIAVNDPAGTAILFASAINRLTPHRCRLITWQRRYVCEFPSDVHLADLPCGGWAAVGELLRQADVAHFHMTADETLVLGPHRLSGLLRGKAVVRHHHGEPALRDRLGEFQRRYSHDRPSDVVLVATPDMLELFPPGRVEWVANLVPLSAPEYRPRSPADPEHRGPLRVCQSPTRTAIKSTSVCIAACEAVTAEGWPIECDIVTWAAHAEVLRRKRQADVVFDQMDFSFGVSSLEALALGTPVICRLDAVQCRRIAEYAGCMPEDLPWLNVGDVAELRAVMRRLAEDAHRGGRRELAALGRRSRQFMERWWPESAGVERLVAAYTRALESPRLG